MIIKDLLAGSVRPGGTTDEMKPTQMRCAILPLTAPYFSDNATVDHFLERALAFS